jgi:hypothetical protein
MVEYIYLQKRRRKTVVGTFRPTYYGYELRTVREGK